MLSHLYRLANDLNYAVASPIFNKILLSSSLKLLSIECHYCFFQPSPLLCDHHSRQMSVLHSTTLKRLALLIFPALSGKRPVSCAMLLLLYYYQTLPACNPTNTLACCVSYRKAQLYCSNVFTSSVWKTLKKLMEIFEKLVIHLRYLRGLWFFAAV